jgi:hypothetical protein
MDCCDDEQLQEETRVKVEAQFHLIDEGQCEIFENLVCSGEIQLYTKDTAEETFLHR